MKAANHLDLKSLFESYQSDIYRFAFVIVRNDQLAQDIVQEVFVKALQHSDQLRDHKKTKVWLLAIAKNTAYDLLDKHSREASNLQMVFSITGHTDEKQFEFSEMIECLSETDRQIVTLHIVNGLKHHEISEAVNLKPGAVRKRYSRALILIKKNL